MKRKVSNKNIRKVLRQIISEGHGSSYMAKSQLYNIARKAQSMFNKLEKGQPLDDWMESHIAKMDSMMDSVNDSFTYDHHEGKGCPKGMYWCEKDQICKPDSQNMNLIISTQDMMEQDFTVEPQIPTQPREKDIRGVFGDKYGPYIPMDVLRYMRKNPEAIIKRLYGLYGDKIYDYMPK
jgi:hypothetical protein